MQEKKEKSITLRDICLRCNSGTYQLVPYDTIGGYEKVEETNYAKKELLTEGFFAKTKGINDQECFQKRRAYTLTLATIDEKYKEREDKAVIEKLNEYINQLDSYQQVLDNYRLIQNKTDTDTAQLLASVEILRQKSAELHALLVGKSANFVAPITSFIGATLGLALAPLAFVFGVFVLLVGLVLGGALALTACMPHTKAFSFSESIKLLLIFASAPIVLPCATVIKGAKLGHQTGEHFFFKAPKKIDAFREKTMNIVDNEVSDYTFPWKYLTWLDIGGSQQGAQRTEESSRLDDDNQQQQEFSAIL